MKMFKTRTSGINNSKSIDYHKIKQKFRNFMHLMVIQTKQFEEYI